VLLVSGILFSASVGAEIYKGNFTIDSSLYKEAPILDLALTSMFYFSKLC
jgi:hypothetical protein